MPEPRTPPLTPSPEALGRFGLELREQLAANGRAEYVIPGNEVTATNRVVRDMIKKHGGRWHVERREWVLPGGGMEPGETPADTVRRECREETRLEVEPLRILGVYSGPGIGTTYANGDRAMWVVTVFEARIVSGESRPDGEEVVDIGWFRPDELDGLETSPATRAILGDALAGVSFR